MPDTVRAVRDTAAAIATLGVSLALLNPLPSFAQPRELAARVVWARADRAYVASPDSTALEPGLVLTFMDRRRAIASGEISRVVDGALATVRLTTGSLERVKKLDRLRVLAERPPIRARALLRVGFPAGGRSNPLFGCEESEPRLPLPPLAYRREAIGPREWRWVREAPGADGPPWPDTLRALTFRDADDEMIALERGDLDVAVFWPGERSARLRADAKWRDALLGLRARGVLATVDPAAASGGATGGARFDSVLASLNPGLFGGDLLPWFELDPASGAAGATAPGPSLATSRPYSVDLALPGQQAIEHFLNGGASLFVRGKVAPLRVTFLDLPLAPRDSLRADWAPRGITPLFAVRCAVLCAPDLRAYVQALGPDAFAEAVRCEPAERRP